MHHLWTGQDFGDRLPSEVFREHFLTCFIADPVGVQLRHLIGIDNIAWECDYPHSDSSWPDAPEELAARRSRRACPTTRSTRSRFENAMPLVLVRPVRPPAPRSSRTVGALRAEAAGHDVSIRAYDKGRFTARKGVDLGKLAARATA